MHQPEYRFNCEESFDACCKGRGHDKNTLKEYLSEVNSIKKLVLVCDFHYQNHKLYRWDNMVPICKKAKGLKVCNCRMCRHSKTIKSKRDCPCGGTNCILFSSAAGTASTI